MNSSRISTMKIPTRVEARLLSTWIERFGLPLAVSAMEAQPIGMAVALVMLLFERWREWWQRWRPRKRTAPALDTLDPDSVCARYRELLQAVATEKSALARQASETPAEYEARLLPHLAAPDDSDRNDTETTILDELTEAYMLERYGSERADERMRQHLRRWVPHLIARLIGKKEERS